MPCYFKGAALGALWSEIENAAPQGVHYASTAEVLNSSCLGRLDAYIVDTGGKHFNPGDVPPP